MKTKTLILAIAALSIPALSIAEGEKQGEKGKKCCAKRHAHMLEKFDADGDGKLNEEERKVAKAERKARRAEFIAKYDSDGDGKLSADEKKAARDLFIAQYDTDGDGKLSKSERTTAKEAGAKFPRFCHAHSCRKNKKASNRAN